ncbi:MAG: redox-regulated ATPase YchF [Candidatus Lloydbacteria bacterium CG22_combo_CG10-13_8_21_14_all_47_15]|uniref:Ribosome-binding ATPase YchF n=1 Tax=Candidatus Lloydbacteria bacterium CG22_combo_CG10-13_8_21_14_all_47_15 TaxID=1974635 RepID=A0A2H0CSZ6_9BACT|nr:MAG: redox-regulated ATPase YchF [Candidatus Lloydbacteria bacterium CG22_combo_CG10-13_8_21_14_all_47_15]
MSLSIGIVGLPNVGKSTLFNALTKKAVAAENYPFTTIDPSVGVVAVPDERLWKLSEFSHSEKTIPAAIEFVDIAGLVKGASAGEGLGNKFLANIREVDAILEVVRIFDDANITHVHGKVHPLSDIEIINLELMMADLQTVAKRLGNLEKEVKRGDKDAHAEKSLLEKISAILEAGKLAQDAELSKEEKMMLQGLHLLTMKPILYAFNMKVGSNNIDVSSFADLISKYVVFDAKIEDELKEFEGEERAVFRQELGAAEGSDGIDALIRASYELLELITFFTTGEDETRAWTIKKDSTAPEAGTAIHTDFRDKFIRADVIHWQTLLDAGSYAAAREKGMVKTEGKEYIVADGDVIEFKI